MEHLAPLWWWVVLLVVSFTLGYNSKSFIAAFILGVIWWFIWNLCAYQWGLVQ